MEDYPKSKIGQKVQENIEPETKEYRDNLAKSLKTLRKNNQSEMAERLLKMEKQGGVDLKKNIIEDEYDDIDEDSVDYTDLNKHTNLVHSAFSSVPCKTPEYSDEYKEASEDMDLIRKQEIFKNRWSNLLSKYENKLNKESLAIQDLLENSHINDVNFYLENYFDSSKQNLDWNLLIPALQKNKIKFIEYLPINFNSTETNNVYLEKAGMLGVGRNTIIGTLPSITDPGAESVYEQYLQKLKDIQSKGRILSMDLDENWLQIVSNSISFIEKELSDS